MRKRLAIFALLLAAVMLALPSQALAEGHWADSAVTALNKIYDTNVFVADDGAMTVSDAESVLKAMGVSSEKLDTQADFTRSVACEVLADVFDLPVGSSDSAITYLYRQNIISGTSEDNLDENGTVSKAQFAVLTYRVLNSVGGGLGSSTGLKPGTDEYFAWMYLAARKCVTFDTESTQGDITEDEWNAWVNRLNSLNELDGSSSFTPGYHNETRLTAAVSMVNAYIDAGGPSTIFSDVVPGDYAKGGAYYDGVMYLFDSRIVSGNGNGTFGPDNELPRKQLAVLLCRLDNQNCTLDEAPGYAVEKDYISAPSEASEEWWNATATREEAIVAFMKQANVNVTNVNTGILSKFTDADSIPDEAKPYLAYAVSLGIVSGTSPTTIEPNSVVTRGQAGVLLYRILLGVDETKMEDYRLSVASVLGNENASISLLSESKQLDLRETWRLTSDLEANVPEDTTLTISGTIYEMGGKLINTGEGTITFADEAGLTPVYGTVVAKVGNAQYVTLSDAIAAASAGDTVTLLADATEGQVIEIDKNLTLNLNGHVISNGVTGDRLFHVTAPVSFTVDGTDSGSGMSIPADNTGSYGFIKVAAAATVTLNGGSYAGDTDNGSFIKAVQTVDEDETSDANGCTVILSEVTAVTNKRMLTTDTLESLILRVTGGSYTAEAGVPEYDERYNVFGVDQYTGTSTFTGVTITTGGGAGVELTGGYNNSFTDCTVTVTAASDPSFVASAVAASYEGVITINGGTYSSAGYGVYVFSSGGTIDVADGDISGAIAAARADVDSDTYGSPSTINISGGRFAGQLQTNDNADANIYVTGGLFDTDPTAYLADGRAAVDSGDPVYHYTVAEAGENPAEVVAASADVKVSESLSAEEKTAAEAFAEALADPNKGGSAEPGIGEALSAAASTVAQDNQVTAATPTDNGRTVLDDLRDATDDDNIITSDDVTIVIQPYLDIQVTGATVDGASKTVTLDITPMYITVATTADPTNIVLDDGGGAGVNAVQVGEPQELVITKPVTVTLSLPNEFTSENTLYVRHAASNGRTYFYTGSVASNVLTFTNPHGFSEFTIMSENGAEAELNGIGYDTLTNALADAKDGEVVKVLKGALTASMSGASRTITLENGTSESITVTINGQQLTIGNGATTKFAYTAPSGGGSVATTYSVTVAEAENGKVSASATSAAEGEKVTVTATPDEGYEVASVAVTSGNQRLEVADNGDGTYSFEMPAGDVTVAVAFGASAPVVELPFTDVAEGDWYYGPVAFVYAKGLMTGYEGTTLFGPEDALGREQAAAVLFRALGAGAQAPACGLADVDQAGWYAQSVNWAVASGLLTGYADGSGLFGVGDALTRDQFAAIVARVAGADLSKADPSALEAFSDGDAVAEWAVPAVSWAAQVGILEGSDDGEGGMELRSSAEITRGEMAAMIQRAAEAGLLPTA